jgi:hypothetical protein
MYLKSGGRSIGSDVFPQRHSPLSSFGVIARRVPMALIHIFRYHFSQNVIAEFTTPIMLETS